MNIPKTEFYRLLRTVPPGRVTTYKALAHAFRSKAYRYVGQLLRQNPDAPATPCHRVVLSNGSLGGYMGQTSNSSLQKKKDLLIREGIKIMGDKIVDFEKVCISRFPIIR